MLHPTMQEYINSVAQADATRTSMSNFLSLFYAFVEKHADGDITKITRELVIDYFNQGNWKDLQAVRNALAIIGRYLQFAHLDDVVTGIQDEDINLVDNYREGLFARYEDVYRFISRYRSVDEGYNIFPFSIFAWMGVPFNAMGNVRKEDIDLDNKRIFIAGIGTRQLEDIMVSILRRYLKAETHQRENRKWYTPTFKEDRFLLKMIPKNQANVNLEIDRKDVHNAFTDIRQLSNHHKFSYKEIALSGNLHRMYLLECNGIDVYCIKNFPEIKSVFGLEEKTHKRHKDLIRQYDIYKQVFNLR